MRHDVSSVFFKLFLKLQNTLCARRTRVRCVRIPAGEGPALPPWSPDSDALSVPVGALVGLILILLVLALVVLDIVCCKTKRRGQILKKIIFTFLGSFWEFTGLHFGLFFFSLQNQALSTPYAARADLRTEPGEFFSFWKAI